ncbi:hypothetical protein O3P69_019651 [Scylla paramamosain]|uniref:Uncharacterized protein n=1 Tax=Scylla paramamosain TaxID=85552 RepID=A0AAW0SXT6_SCYPA
MAAAAAAWEVDYSHLKLVCILMDAGGAVLSYALKCGTNKTASVTLLDHLKNSPVTSTANYHKLNVFENNPNCITENTTQASLYSRIHEWCTEELRDRISVHPTWGKKRPHTLRARIKRVVKEMYQVALQGLLLDRQSLSEEDTEWLTDCCEREDLPAQEVLEAFFTLQSSITNRIRQENYVMHHKGMLEYFAARHIMQCLQGGSHPGPGAISSLLQGAAQPQTQPLGLHYGFHPEPGAIRSLPQGAAQPQTQPLGLHYGFHPEPGAIRSLPRGAARPQTQPLDLQGLRNLFWHVAGMLATEEAPNCTESIKEVIELLGKTGAAWDEWLSLVEDTDYNESFLQGIAHHVTENPSHGTVRISDNSLASAAALLPRTPTTTVLVTMQNEKVNVENVRALVDHHCSELHLQHHYKHPANTCVSDTVLRAIHRSHLKVFTGHLSANCVVVLPECLEELCLAVSSDEHTASLTAVLTQAISSLPNLRRLVIHVPVAMVTPAAVLSPLPDIRDVSLALSGVDKSLMEEACHVAAALQPRTGYDVTAFPWGSMEAAEWRRLLHLLAAAPARGRWGGVWIPEETITEEEETELMDLADTLLGCGLFRHPSEECFLSYSPDDHHHISLLHHHSHHSLLCHHHSHHNTATSTTACYTTITATTTQSLHHSLPKVVETKRHPLRVVPPVLCCIKCCTPAGGVVGVLHTGVVKGPSTSDKAAPQQSCTTKRVAGCRLCRQGSNMGNTSGRKTSGTDSGQLDDSANSRSHGAQRRGWPGKTRPIAGQENGLSRGDAHKRPVGKCRLVPAGVTLKRTLRRTSHARQCESLQTDIQQVSSVTISWNPLLAVCTASTLRISELSLHPAP